MEFAGAERAVRTGLAAPIVSAGKKRGTGLGLAVARRFVEDHGGRLVLLPEPPDAAAGDPCEPRGASFRIELPLLPPRSER
jgi:signal transduction histidine kinase